MPIRLAVVGDIHNRWSEADVRWFDQADYDAVLVVGDLAGLRFKGTQAIAQSLSTLATRTILVPGNHDASHAIQLLGESIRRPGLGRPFVKTQQRNLQALREATAPQELGAYSLHRVADVTILAARPHSMGGPSLAFAPHLSATWGITDLTASEERLKQLVDEAETEQLVFVAHNGPSGLGAERSDIWGCDFRAAGGDWGDPDLEGAIHYAKSIGKRVLAVAAGHMHRRIRGGGERTWQLRRDSTLYVNAAEVPRIDRAGRRHHVSLTIAEREVTLDDRWIEDT